MRCTVSLRAPLEDDNHFWANYIVDRTYGEMTDAYYSEYRYPYGLILEIPENEGDMVGFTITGEPYIMLLSNGNKVRIGMRGDALAKIFPDSFANRKPISEIRGKEGKISFIVKLA